MLSNFADSLTARIAILELLGNLGLSVIFALVLSFVIRRFSRIVGDRSQHTVVILVLMPTMVLIISVVRSSLALSLGLVGALSIVRFRTPIKEPEELVYLFVAIAVGLGLGANQTLPTALAFVFVMAVLVVAGLLRRGETSRGVFLDVDGAFRGGATGVDSLCAVLRQRSIPFELRRYTESPAAVSATFVVEAATTRDLELVVADLRQAVPDGSITLIDRARHLN
jgi:hypothetical protein